MRQQFILRQEKNQIGIHGQFGVQDVRRVLATIHNTINNRGYSDIVLDFTGCIAAFPGAMLTMCAHAMLLQMKRIDVALIEPESERMASLFRSTGWAHFICPRQYEAPKRSPTSRQFPVVQYRTHEEQEKALNDLLEKLLAVIPNFNRAAFASVEWALNEISDNVLNHASSPIGGLLQLSVFELTRHRVEFTISDGGVGVPRTLRAVKSEIETDADALLQSVRSGVTRNPPEFQGNGLYGTLEICRVGGGRFSLNAGNGALICANASVSARNESIPFSGTTVDALIDFSEPALLEKALMIDGKVHKPVDYIELSYEQEGQNFIPYSLNEQASSFRSRLAGRPVRTKLTNLVSSCEGRSIIVNFQGIPVISSSFADEVFGKLFSELGPMRFMQSIKLINVSPTVQALIDRAITQRMQEPRT